MKVRQIFQMDLLQTLFRRWVSLKNLNKYDGVSRGLPQLNHLFDRLFCHLKGFQKFYSEFLQLFLLLLIFFLLLISLYFFLLFLSLFLLFRLPLFTHCVHFALLKNRAHFAAQPIRYLQLYSMHQLTISKNKYPNPLY